MKLIKFLFKSAILLVVLAIALYCAICIYFPVKNIDVINKYSEKYNLDPALVCAVIKAESNFSPDAQSHKGARGLMQLMPETIDWAVKEIPIENFSYTYIEEPEVNIEIGCWILNYLITNLKDEKLAVAAYNAGIGNVQKWLKDENYSKDGENLHSIPYEETKNYVKKVENYKKIYDILLRYDFYEIEKKFN